MKPGLCRKRGNKENAAYLLSCMQPVLKNTLSHRSRWGMWEDEGDQ